MLTLMRFALKYENHKDKQFDFKDKIYSIIFLKELVEFKNVSVHDSFFLNRTETFNLDTQIEGTHQSVFEW